MKTIISVIGLLDAVVGRAYGICRRLYRIYRKQSVRTGNRCCVRRTDGIIGMSGFVVLFVLAPMIGSAVAVMAAIILY